VCCYGVFPELHMNWCVGAVDVAYHAAQIPHMLHKRLVYHPLSCAAPLASCAWVVAGLLQRHLPRTACCTATKATTAHGPAHPPTNLTPSVATGCCRPGLAPPTSARPPSMQTTAARRPPTSPALTLAPSASGVTPPCLSPMRACVRRMARRTCCSGPATLRVQGPTSAGARCLLALPRCVPGAHCSMSPTAGLFMAGDGGAVASGGPASSAKSKHMPRHGRTSA
jgi:hypothetical protein